MLYPYESAAKKAFKYKLVKVKRLNLIDELKLILRNEIQDLESNLLKSRLKKKEITDRPLSKLADHNDIIRINTLEWVLKIIAKLES
jgi:hypothetical protein